MFFFLKSRTAYVSGDREKTVIQKVRKPESKSDETRIMVLFGGMWGEDHNPKKWENRNPKVNKYNPKNTRKPDSKNQ